MKAILSLIISGALVVSGYSQTRNVLVGTNNAVVQPTNFWSADASNARTGLGLGTAATNSASAFQPASLALSNLASSNGGALTNLQATNLVGLIPTSNIPPIVLTNIGTVTISQGGTGATNAANARQNLGSTTVGDALFIATNAAAARTTIGATTVGSSVFTLVNPSAITFLRLNADNTASALSASDFRTALSLGTAATNPSSAFQPASSVLTNLASSNGGVLTNIQASNIVGAIAISNGGSGATTAGGARTNLSLGATNSAFVGLSVGTNNTNLSEDNSSAFGAQNFIDSTAEESFAFGAANQITNMPAGAGGSVVMGVLGTMTNQGAFLFNGVPQGGAAGYSRGNNTFAVNASNGIYLNGSLFLEGVQGAATDSAILQITAGGVVARTMTNKSTAVPAFFGWSGFVNTAFTAGEARTNLGLGSTNLVQFAYVEAPYFFVGDSTNGIVFETSDVAAITRTNLGLGATNNVSFGGVVVGGDLKISNGSLYWDTNVVFEVETSTFQTQVSFVEAAATRTNLGLGWPALTNTNTSGFNASLYGSGTNPVLYSTNGEVVSPTNFWQAAPINTRVQISHPVVNATNNATNARNLFLYSLAISTTGITNTIQLPTNGGTFLGDVATVIHEGPTSSVTAVRQTGAGTNLITLNQFQEAVKFIYESGGWRLADNISYVEPIYFSGTNASANAAASRTNLGLGAESDVVFNSLNAKMDAGSGNPIFFHSEIAFDDIHSEDIIEKTRTNLGLPLAALTNTNNANFQAAVFATNAAPTNSANVNGIGFNTAVAWMEVTVQTNGTNATFRIPLFQ